MTEGFKLSLGPSSYMKDESNISDAMAYHDGQSFSTHDKDNDATSMHCAKQSQVGPWKNKIYKIVTNQLGNAPTRIHLNYKMKSCTKHFNLTGKIQLLENISI